MKKYKSRLVIVEAVQIDNNNIEEVAEWCGGTLPAKWTAYLYIELRTPKGFITGGIGEWIVKDEQGEFTSCKHDIFEVTYEPLINV